jgi:hypothetical protein
MVFNATFNNISVTSWRSILLVEETGVTGVKPTDQTSNMAVTEQTILISFVTAILQYICNAGQ